MAKCTNCGKKGLFLKVKNGLCIDCIHKQQLQAKDDVIKNLEFQLLPEQRDIVKLTAEIQRLTACINDLIAKKQNLDGQNAELLNEIQSKKSEIIILDDEILYQSFGLYTPLYDFAKSEDYKDRLAAIRANQKEMIKNKTACYFRNDWTLNGSVAQGRRMTQDNVKQVIRCFNSECDEIIDNVKFSNIQSMRDRINKSFEQLNKINTLNAVSINPKYRNLKIDELNLAYEYQLKKQQEKEELKEQRAALREQAKLEAEIKEAREKLEKDRKHFTKAIKDIEYKLKFAINDDEKADLSSKLYELNGQMGNLEAQEKQIDYREANAKAGYVYIISNIGAFGENVFKIGMTRRLEPYDRIDELSGASVPFSFDIHAMIFSENAPELEAKLHRHFEHCRLNKINNRKEFYRCPIEEIEKVVKENYDKTLDIIKIPEAQQYRESLMLENQQ